MSRTSLSSTVNFFASLSWTFEVHVFCASESCVSRSAIDVGRGVDCIGLESLRDLDSRSVTWDWQWSSLLCGDDLLKHSSNEITNCKVSVTLKTQILGLQYFVLPNRKQTWWSSTTKLDKSSHFKFCKFVQFAKNMAKTQLKWLNGTV